MAVFVLTVLPDYYGKVKSEFWLDVAVFPLASADTTM